MIAALRGLNGFFLDLYDAPGLITRALEQDHKIIDTRGRSSTCISGSFRRSWVAMDTSTATGRLAHSVIQEDMMGLASPDLLRRPLPRT